MPVARITKTLKIDGMTCSSCENRIEKKLLSLAGITEAKVSYPNRKAVVNYDESVINLQEIIGAVKRLDYEASEASDSAASRTSITKVVGVGLIIFAIYFIIDRLGGFKAFNSFPFAKEGMGYGMLFIIGLLTSVYCIAMCGGINISQSVSKASTDSVDSIKLSALRPPFLYNAGRAVSYTIIGGIIGAIGSVVSFSGSARGIVQLAAGIFMIIMDLNMLNIFPSLSRFVPRMPKSLASKIGLRQQSRSPFNIGLLNGLMPCGPLQAMQLYALSTGSIIGGALSMAAVM